MSLPGAKAAKPFVDLPPLARDLDVVIFGRSQLGDLQQWQRFLKHYHLIVVLENPATGADQTALSGFDYEIITRADVERVLGPKAWIIASKGSAAKCIGFLVSKKKYILCLDGDAAVAKDPKGEDVNALQQHITNLQTPSTPFFFNTLYDPYRPGTDFVRGYPFSLREGAPTAVSHGLWMRSPAKPGERYVDAVLTVPKGSLFPTASINLAFNRELVGPAMYLPGAIAEGAPAGFEDTWAGCCAKVISDHLGWGCKTGLPYVQYPDAASLTAPKEQQASAWQDTVFKFFSTVQLSKESTTAEQAYLELAGLARAQLSSTSPFFGKVADAMVAWIDAWKQLAGSTATSK